MELLPSLLSGLRTVCAGSPDPRKGRGGNIAAADFGLSAFSMFFMQSGSFLSFQRSLEKGQGRSNCQSLFGIGKIPSDNYIRYMLDAVDPALLAPCFLRMEQLLREPALRQSFGRLGGRTLIALDGTEYFCSQKIGCPQRQTRKRADGKVESYHSMLAATVVAPGHAKVVPLAPEFIAKQDGAEKQDCERAAVKRWHDKHGARLAPLRPVYLGDDLFGYPGASSRPDTNRPGLRGSRLTRLCPGKSAALQAPRVCRSLINTRPRRAPPSCPRDRNLRVFHSLAGSFTAFTAFAGLRAGLDGFSSTAAVLLPLRCWPSPLFLANADRCAA
jgi:hypothetical protein